MLLSPLTVIAVTLDALNPVTLVVVKLDAKPVIVAMASLASNNTALSKLVSVPFIKFQVKLAVIISSNVFVTSSLFESLYKTFKPYKSFMLLLPSNSTLSASPPSAVGAKVSIPLLKLMSFLARLLSPRLLTLRTSPLSKLTILVEVTVPKLTVSTPPLKLSTFSVATAESENTSLPSPPTSVTPVAEDVRISLPAPPSIDTFSTSAPNVSLPLPPKSVVSLLMSDAICPVVL